ncbi:MAG TPA: hypothetical protein VNO55_32825 [Polyangia bacterium]|nr:hypothetical protein [Polyangia bacterium]
MNHRCSFAGGAILAAALALSGCGISRGGADAVDRRCDDDGGGADAGAGAGDIVSPTGEVSQSDDAGAIDDGAEAGAGGGDDAGVEGAPVGDVLDANGQAVGDDAAPPADAERAMDVVVAEATAEAPPEVADDLAIDLMVTVDVPGVDVPVAVDAAAESAPETVVDAGADAPADDSAAADAAAAADTAAQDAVVDRGAPDMPAMAFHWANTPPAGNPFPMSTSIREVVFTGRHALYGAADTFIPTWGSDDNLYTPWTYGTVNGVNLGDEFGWAKFQGTDPLSLTVAAVGKIDVGAPGSYGGAFPAASLILNGVWYYGGSAEDGFNGACGFWCVGGPFIGFWISTDYGAHWAAPPNGYASALFGESAKNGAKVKMGGPRVVDFGKDLASSPDGKTYLIGSGATNPGAMDNWVTADQIYLSRVALSPATANDVTAWEFFAGHDADGKAVWSHAFADIKPLLEWPGQMGSVSMTYLASLHKYLMAVSRPGDGFNTYGEFDTYFLEADTITGPYRMVQYLKSFGVQAYYVNMPSRFVGADGHTLWIQYSSGDYQAENPPGSRYAMSFQEVVLVVH